MDWIFPDLQLDPDSERVGDRGFPDGWGSCVCRLPGFAEQTPEGLPTMEVTHTGSRSDPSNTRWVGREDGF